MCVFNELLRSVIVGVILSHVLDSCFLACDHVCLVRMVCDSVVPRSIWAVHPKPSPGALGFH